MSLKQLFNMLRGFGFTQSDAKIYVYLAKKGPRNAREICNELEMTKQQVYPCLENLQNRGIVTATTEHPTIFHALPFEKVLDTYASLKIDDAKSAQQNKTELLKQWQSFLNKNSPENV